MAEADTLFLPAGYRTNPQASADAAGTPFWERGEEGQDLRFQDPVYRWAAQLVTDHGWRTVVDVGCGSGHKLALRLGGTAARLVGLDQPSATAIGAQRFGDLEFVTGDLADDAVWHEVEALTPDLALSIDVIEHLDDPRGLLRHLHRLPGPDGRVLLSTPDRAELDQGDPAGPPGNPRHVREWAADELAALVRSERFEILEHRHLLPRSYSWTVAEARRTLGRLRRRWPVPDRRSCQALLLAPIRD